MSVLSIVGTADVGFCHVTGTDHADCVSFELAIPYASRRLCGALRQVWQGASASRVAKCVEIFANNCPVSSRVAHENSGNSLLGQL